MRKRTTSHHGRLHLQKTDQRLSVRESEERRCWSATARIVKPVHPTNCRTQLSGTPPTRDGLERRIENLQERMLRLQPSRPFDNLARAKTHQWREKAG